MLKENDPMKCFGTVTMDDDVTKKIKIPDTLPFLRAICWQIKDPMKYSTLEMLSRYENGWKYRGVVEDLNDEELAFVRLLVNLHGSWIANDI